MRAGALSLTATLLFGACGGTTTPQPLEARPASGTSPDATDTPPRAEPRELGAGFRPLQGSEPRVLEALVARTHQVRGLTPVRPIRARVGGARAIAAHLTSKIEDDDLVDVRDLYVALGMLPPDLDVVAFLAEVTAEQVIGFYDPELDVLVVRDDVMASLVSGSPDPEALLTLAHEIVHALQGQHLDLLARMEREDATMDEDNAFTSLAEGDATLGMLLVGASIGRVPTARALASLPSSIAEGLESTGEAEPSVLDGAPPIIRAGLTVPYVAGLLFCADRYRAGGFRAVDAAHRDLPATTEQVFHPEKYVAGERALPVRIGPMPAIEGAGFALVREDTLGELEVGIYLARGTTEDVDFAGAAGWGGDRVRVVRRGDELGAVFFVSFDTEADAVEAERALASRDAGDVGRLVRRDGRALGIAHGLPESLHAAVVAELATQPGASGIR